MRDYRAWKLPKRKTDDFSVFPTGLRLYCYQLSNALHFYTQSKREAVSVGRNFRDTYLILMCTVHAVILIILLSTHATMTLLILIALQLP